MEAMRCYGKRDRTLASWHPLPSASNWQIQASLASLRGARSAVEGKESSTGSRHMFTINPTVVVPCGFWQDQILESASAPPSKLIKALSLFIGALPWPCNAFPCLMPQANRSYCFSATVVLESCIDNRPLRLCVTDQVLSEATCCESTYSLALTPRAHPSLVLSHCRVMVFVLSRSKPSRSLFAVDPRPRSPNPAPTTTEPIIGAASPCSSMNGPFSLAHTP